MYPSGVGDEMVNSIVVIMASDHTPNAILHAAGCRSPAKLTISSSTAAPH